MSKQSNNCRNVLSYLTTLMSGSPIIQNGKLVGAVTHVLISEQTEGYGIFIENMLNEAKSNNIFEQIELLSILSALLNNYAQKVNIF